MNSSSVSYNHNQWKNSLNMSLEVITVKPSHEVTSIKQSPVLKGHIFRVLS